MALRCAIGWHKWKPYGKIPAGRDGMLRTLEICEKCGVGRAISVAGYKEKFNAKQVLELVEFKAKKSK